MRASSCVTATVKAKKEKHAMIIAVVNALQLSSPTPVRGGAVNIRTNVSNTNVSAASTGAAAATRIFDHTGDPI